MSYKWEHVFWDKQEEETEDPKELKRIIRLWKEEGRKWRNFHDRIMECLADPLIKEKLHMGMKPEDKKRFANIDNFESRMVWSIEEILVLLSVLYSSVKDGNAYGDYYDSPENEEYMETMWEDLPTITHSRTKPGGDRLNNHIGSYYPRADSYRYRIDLTYLDTIDISDVGAKELMETVKGFEEDAKYWKENHRKKYEEVS